MKEWEMFFNERAFKQLKEAIRNAGCDEKYLSTGVKGHRRRFVSGERGEVRIGVEEYDPLILEVLKARFLLTLDESGKPQVRKPKRLSKTKFGFEAHKIIEEAKRME